MTDISKLFGALKATTVLPTQAKLSTPNSVSHEINGTRIEQIDTDKMFDDLKKDMGMTKKAVRAVIPNPFPDRSLIEGAILALDGSCDGARTQDGMGFNGQDTGYGKRIARKLLAGETLTPSDIEWALRVLPKYFGTQLTWIEQAKWNTEAEPAKAKAAADLAAEVDRKLALPQTYGEEAQRLFAEIDPLKVPEKDRRFLTSLQTWHQQKGSATVAQRPYVLKLLHAYYKPEFIQKKENSYVFSSQAEQAEVEAEGKSAVPPTQSTQVREKAEGNRTETARVLSNIDPIAGLERVVERKESGQVVPFPVLPLAAASTSHIQFEDLDDSQKAAIIALRSVEYGCLTGAAGTGKTTLEQILLEEITKYLPAMDIANYGRRKNATEEKKPEKLIPAILCCAFTGKATQQMKKSLADKYHPNIMTIHKALGFYPEFFDVENELTGEMESKRRFVPYYTEQNKMPYRVIVIDETGMVPIQLWNQFRAAMQEDCRVYMIGDINQLPPVMGKSVFGFALTRWEAHELTKIHRQKGEHNPIVDNAWRILQGKRPEQVQGRFGFVNTDGGSEDCYRKGLAAIMGLTQRGEFDPRRDAIICAVNGYNPDRPGQKIGQAPMNEKLCTFFNPPPERNNSEQVKGRRVVVQCGFVRKHFAVGDRVMVTENDNERNLTNGMIGEIVDIKRNGALIALRDLEGMDFSSMDEELDQHFKQSASDEQESMDERAASHIITVDFGLTYDGEPIIEEFATIGQLQKLMLGYAFTCHKAQGSQYHTVVIICHSSNAKMLSREWLYTAVTRATDRVIIVGNQGGLLKALNNQRIKGANLKEKAESFLKLSKSNPNEPLPRLQQTEWDRQVQYAAATPERELDEAGDVSDDDEIPF